MQSPLKALKEDLLWSQLWLHILAHAVHNTGTHTRAMPLAFFGFKMVACSVSSSRWVWGCGELGVRAAALVGSEKKMRPSSPPSSPSVVWSQVSGRRVFPAHILWVDLDFIVHCRGTGEASVFSLTSLSSQTGPDMVGMYTHPSSSSQILVSPTAMFHSGMRWECDLTLDLSLPVS